MPYQPRCCGQRGPAGKACEAEQYGGSPAVFSPGDSDRSIGWSTKDDATAVAKWCGDTLHAPLLDF